MWVVVFVVVSVFDVGRFIVDVSLILSSSYPECRDSIESLTFPSYKPSQAGNSRPSKEPLTNCVDALPSGTRVAAEVRALAAHPTRAKKRHTPATQEARRPRQAC